MINKIMLETGIDIPFEEAQLIIHQPTIKEIAYIGQKSFFKGCSYLNFSKNNLSFQDKNNLKDLSDFEILMTLMKEKNQKIQQNKICMQLVLSLLFPDYQIAFLPLSIMLSKDNERHLIDKSNFDNFKIYIQKMFQLKNFLNQDKNYNPGGPQAAAIVKKIQQGKRKRAKLKAQSGEIQEEIEIIAKYISILSIGLQKNKKELSNYTFFQLVSEYNRFILKNQFDTYFSAKLAGAQNIEQVQYWMK